jgi:tetratricopeptide (TPR) repeat protein
MARWLLASSLAERGEFEEALVQGQEGLRIAEEVRHPYSLILMCWGLALVFTLKGEVSHAVVHLERALALCRDWTVPVLSPVTTGFLGYVHMLSGRVAEGLALLEQGKKDAESSGLALYHSRLTVWMGEGFLQAGRLADARAQGERALALTRERGERGLEGWALCLLSEVASRAEPLEGEIAEGCYREVVALADERGLRPLGARCHHGLGMLYRRLDKPQEAQKHLSTAASMFRQMGMRPPLEAAQAAPG